MTLTHTHTQKRTHTESATRQTTQRPGPGNMSAQNIILHNAPLAWPQSTRERYPFDAVFANMMARSSNEQRAQEGSILGCFESIATGWTLGSNDVRDYHRRHAGCNMGNINSYSYIDTRGGAPYRCSRDRSNIHTNICIPHIGTLVRIARYNANHGYKTISRGNMIAIIMYSQGRVY